MATFKIKADVKRKKTKYDVSPIKGPVSFLVDADSKCEAKKILRKELKNDKFYKLIRIKN